jgi:hypothetical protein
VHTTIATTDASYDGDGQQVKRVQTTQINSQQLGSVTTYYLRSSVLGQVITAYDTQGAKQKSYVCGGGALIASSSSAGLVWRYNNPVTGDGRDTDAQGKLVEAAYLDPQGVDVGASDPANGNGEPTPPEPLPHADAYAALLPRSVGGSGRCRLEGFDVGCGWIPSLEATGHVAPGAPAAAFKPVYSRSQSRYVGFARLNPNTGQYVATVFTHFDYTTVTIEGRTSGNTSLANKSASLSSMRLQKAAVCRVSVILRHECCCQTIKEPPHVRGRIGELLHRANRNL